VAEAIPTFTPVSLITGFLGSGKTTLLRRLLESPRLADTAVLINEFGEVGLDHQLLERVDEDMVLLQSGCLCCTIRGDLAEALRGLHSKRDRGIVPAFRRVAIESTGLADPFPVLSTIQADPVLRHHFRVGNVIATVDAVNGAAQLARHPESLRQAAIADRLVVTKTDIARPKATIDLLAQLARLNPAAPVVRGAEDEIDPDDLLLNTAFDLARKSGDARRWLAEAEATSASAGHDGHGHDVNRHGDAIRAFCLRFERPLDWTAFGLWLTMLLNRHGDKVLRVKGILNVAGETAPVAIHGVQHLVHPPVHMRAWPDRDRRSRIVFIVDGLAPRDIERSLAAFDLAAQSEMLGT
jgi:G3E family GTPase